MSNTNKEVSTNAELIDDPNAAHREPEEKESPSAQTTLAEDESALFFAQSLDLLCIAGFDGHFKHLNPAWTTRLGWTLVELQAKPFIDFVHTDDRDATLAEVDRLAEGEQTISFENRYRHRDGSYRWLRWSARSMPERQRIYAIARDVTRQMQLEREILEIADREKERLGRELHDGLCQTLAGIAALSATLSKRLAANTESNAPAAAAEITKLLLDAVNQARDLARGLGPVGLNEAGLNRTLSDLAVNVQNLYRVSCSFACDRPLVKLPGEVESHLFRIAQEAVNNAITHGKGDQIEISLSSDKTTGVLCIQDDGVGVPAEEARNVAGIGMHTMAYRARLIGASLEVRRRAWRGTVVTCAFPLTKIAASRE